MTFLGYKIGTDDLLLLQVLEKLNSGTIGTRDELNQTLPHRRAAALALRQMHERNVPVDTILVIGGHVRALPPDHFRGLASDWFSIEEQRPEVPR